MTSTLASPTNLPSEYPMAARHGLASAQAGWRSLFFPAAQMLADPEAARMWQIVIPPGLTVSPCGLYGLLMNAT